MKQIFHGGNTQTKSVGISKSRARKAGSAYRAYHALGTISEVEMEENREIIEEYRTEFKRPLIKVNNGLRGFIQTLGLKAQVTQRHKRLVTILDKLIRLPGTDLSRIQDIGGCRVITDSDAHTDLRTIENHILQKWETDIVRTYDYIETPRKSGYRAVHIIVKRDGYLIEIQLRTNTMHQWAESVEGLSDYIGENYKQDGAGQVQTLMKTYSELTVLEELNEPLPPELIYSFNRQAEILQAYFDSMGKEMPNG